MKIKEELNKLSDSIEVFQKIDIGYPKEPHIVIDQKKSFPEQDMIDLFNVSPSSCLFGFYRICDGVELPDIDNGYFIYGVEEMISVNTMDSEPNHFSDKAIIVFGADGGGGRFALMIDTDQIYYLPPAEVLNREYRGQNAKLVAPSLDRFISYLNERCISTF